MYNKKEALACCPAFTSGCGCKKPFWCPILTRLFSPMVLHCEYSPQQLTPHKSQWRSTKIQVNATLSIMHMYWWVVAISTSKALLVPYEAHHVKQYHAWMQDPVSSHHHQNLTYWHDPGYSGSYSFRAHDFRWGIWEPAIVAHIVW